MTYIAPRRRGARLAAWLAANDMQQALNNPSKDVTDDWRHRAKEGLTRGQRFIAKALERGGEVNRNPIIRAIMPTSVVFGDDDISRAVRQGASFGFADEITGVLAGDEAKQEARARADAFREAHPIAATGFEIAGSLAATGPAASIGIGKTVLGQLARGALAGAGSGGLYGFGSAEGDWRERLPEAAKSAAWGGAFGAAAPFIPSAAKELAVKPVGRMIMKMLPPDSGTRMRAAQQQALETVLTAFTKAGDSLGDAMKKAEAWAQAGAKPETLIELGGDHVKLLARELFGEADSKARKMAKDFFGERRRGQHPRLVDDVKSATGIDPANYLDEVDILKAAMEAGDNQAPGLLRAMSSGRDVGLKPVPTDVLRRSLNAMTEAEIESFQRGYARGLYERLQRRAKDKTIIYDSSMREGNLRILFGDKTDNILENAARERVMYESNRLAPGLADMGGKGASLADVVRSVADAAGDVMKGPSTAVTRSLMKAKNDTELWAALPETREELAKILLSTDLPDLVQRLAKEKLRLQASNTKYAPNLTYPAAAGAGGNSAREGYENYIGR